MVGRKVGRFHVLAKIGQGGMATVWRARDELLGREVALKILDEKMADSEKVRRRFLHEAQTAARLDHPGAVAVFDSGEFEGIAYIAMRLVDGETLSERVSRSLIPIPEAIRIAIAVAEVLAHAHERGVVHRDVSSRNVMIGRDGRVFVLDFGLALANWESRITSTGATIGTVPYMAPEVLLGNDADARTDLYGLGIVLYEALTGAYPHREGPAAASAFAALHQDPVPLRERRPEVGGDLERIVLKAIARDPGERHQTVRGLITELNSRADHPVGHVREAAGSLTETRPPLPRLAHAEGTRPHPTYLAVLPFRVAGESIADESLATVAGRLPEAIACALAKFPGLRMVPGPAGEVPDEANWKALAQRLGANVLLRGRLDRAGSQIRVSYTIIDPAREASFAGDVVDGSALQPFDVEDHVVASVISALGLGASVTRAAPASKPPDPAANERFAQALAYLRRHDNEASLDGAIRLLEQLIASEGETAAYHAALARAYLHKKDRTQNRSWESRAAGSAARALALDPNGVDAQVAVGYLRSASGLFREAIEAFAAALTKQPENVEALVGAGYAHLGASDPEEALRHASRAISSSSDDWRAHMLMGWIHFTGGRSSEALEPWKRLVEITPDNALGYLNLGNAYYRLDRFDDAVDAYLHSIAVHPYHRAYANLGTALYHLGRGEEALSHFRKATELTPSDPLAWGNLGNACYWIDGHEQEAAKAMDHAIDLMREQIDRNPSLASGWSRLAGWLASRGRPGEAETAIHRALELAPRDADCMVRAAHVFFQLGNKETCLHWLREGVRGGYGRGELVRSREFAPLREDREFLELVGTVASKKEENSQT